MQSVDDETPDPSGPISLGTYKFTRRSRSKRYETHRLSEVKEIEETESDNKVTEPAATLSAHPPFNPPPLTTLPSSQLPAHPAHQIEGELNDSIISRLDNTSPDRSGFHEPGPPQFSEFEPSRYTAKLPSLINPRYTDRRTSQPSGQANSSFTPAQHHSSSQVSRALINTGGPSLQSSAQVFPSFAPAVHNSNQYFSATTRPYNQIPRPALGQAEISFPLQNYSSYPNSNALINIDRRSQQAFTQAQPSFPLPDPLPDISQQASQLTKRLHALIKADRRVSKASGQTNSSSPHQNIPQHTSESHCAIESRVNNPPATHGQSLQPSNQNHRPTSSTGHSSPRSLPLSDTLRTATFNLETHQWDPDLPEEKMSTQTPTNKPTRGAHSAQHSSTGSTSRIPHANQTVRNPHAILTTTKSGRPYTNPYMPIDPPPTTARQITRDTSSEHIDMDTQYDDPDIVQLQRKMRYIDQEEARYRALEQTRYEHPEESLDDPFQDQPTNAQDYARNHTSGYVEHARQQAAYDQVSGSGHQSTFNTYASDPNAFSFLSSTVPTSYAPSAGISAYRGQRSTYEQQAGPSYDPQHLRNPRASVRLPAVRGTLDQPKTFLQESNLERLPLEDSAGKATQDQRRRHVQGGVQPAVGRESHAIPIRDPAAYTGSGLTTRRNQEALRHNLDTVVASSQGPTASARTVMNDPHRDRQPSRRPSSTVTDTTVTASTLRAQAPSYEVVATERQPPIHPTLMEPGIIRQGKAAPGENEIVGSQYYADNTLKSPERAATNTKNVNLRESFRAPTIPPGFGNEAATYTKNAGLPTAAIGAGNAFMNELAKKVPSKQNTQQRMEDAAAWFRADPRDLSYAAAILPQETMHRMNPEQFPVEDTAPRTVGQLADESQDDEPSDPDRKTATPRPIGHGRPAGLATPPSIHGPQRAASQAPFSTLASVASIDDTEGMARSGREFLKNDAQAIEQMFGGVYGNLMTDRNGPYDYLSHYCPPPAYAIDHNAKNNNTFFDPQWFATAPPARVGRDSRREQGEYEDPTQGSAGRRGDYVRGDAVRRDSDGRGGTGGRAWGRI